MQHAAMIAALILERPMCLDCIATKASLSRDEVAQYLTVISRAVMLRSAPDQCRACGASRTTYLLARPD